MDKNAKTLMVNILVYLIFIIGIAFLYKSAIYSNLLAIVLLAITFFYFHNPKDLLYFIVGLVLTTSTEILSVKLGIWHYAYPHLLGIPIWLSLGWAYSFVFIRQFETSIFKLEHVALRYSEYFKKAKNIIIYDLAIFLIALVLILTFWRANFLLTILLGIILIGYIIQRHDKGTIFLVTSAMITYSIIDISITHIGLWTYTNTNLSTITTWLPVGYGLIAIIVSRISESLNIILLEKKSRSI